ncbi:hypothetical protein GCM10009676_10280 [Prauserella halophila]|uniref:Uncharacterized protein n=1 Tax=Prauserella halophila TaxID=185641 RepID=A0ABN1W0D8_9PSEU|nr:hypothetical protein [Prauserella halophila]MCP2235385.1 hypothetical protein [Prauserella halophila]
MSTDHLDDLIAENQQRRTENRADDEQAAADTARLIDHMDHPHENEQQRARRQGRQSERERLRQLGVQLDPNADL